MTKPIDADPRLAAYNYVVDPTPENLETLLSNRRGFSEFLRLYALRRHELDAEQKYNILYKFFSKPELFDVLADDQLSSSSAEVLVDMLYIDSSSFGRIEFFAKILSTNNTKLLEYFFTKLNQRLETDQSDISNILDTIIKSIRKIEDLKDAKFCRDKIYGFLQFNAAIKVLLYCAENYFHHEYLDNRFWSYVSAALFSNSESMLKFAQQIAASRFEDQKEFIGLKVLILIYFLNYNDSHLGNKLNEFFNDENIPLDAKNALASAILNVLISKSRKSGSKHISGKAALEVLKNNLKMIPYWLCQNNAYDVDGVLATIASEKLPVEKLLISDAEINKSATTEHEKMKLNEYNMLIIYILLRSNITTSKILEICDWLVRNPGAKGYLMEKQTEPDVLTLLQQTLEEKYNKRCTNIKTTSGRIRSFFSSSRTAQLAHMEQLLESFGVSAPKVDQSRPNVLATTLQISAKPKA